MSAAATLPAPRRAAATTTEDGPRATETVTDLDELQQETAEAKVVPLPIVIPDDHRKRLVEVLARVLVARILADLEVQPSPGEQTEPK